MFETWQLIGLLGIPIGLVIGMIVEWRRKQHARHFKLSDEDKQASLAVLQEMRRRELYEGDVYEEGVLGIIAYLLKYPYVKPHTAYEKEVWRLFKQAKKGIPR